MTNINFILSTAQFVISLLDVKQQLLTGTKHSNTFFPSDRRSSREQQSRSLSSSSQLSRSSKEIHNSWQRCRKYFIILYWYEWKIDTLTESKVTKLRHFLLHYLCSIGKLVRTDRIGVLDIKANLTQLFEQFQLFVTSLKIGITTPIPSWPPTPPTQGWWGWWTGQAGPWSPPPIMCPGGSIQSPSPCITPVVGSIFF